MDPDRWRRIEDLYHAALEHDPSNRDSFLQEVCGSDASLHREIEELIDYQSRAENFIETPAMQLMARRNPNDFDLDERVGAVIGRYHLLEKIGEGGMGEVWLAEQREPVRLRVAAKLVKVGMNTREVIARFESERQALALMDHPAIARVYDAGSTPRGAPYFVMELVAGVPITSYCDNHRLNIRERLELFAHVCEGVQHAHQKAIIHRDLKPSNILVTEVDGRAVPKIIDFGIAKAVKGRLSTDTAYTRVGTVVGTPEYMSPEQAATSGEDVDTRTDVYSLGVILYELLTGVPPIDLRGIAFEELLRRLREDEPPKPSTRILAQAHATLTDLAHKRGTDPTVLSRQVGGDLGSITLKALAKERSRRYASASDFAADIGRYLANEPVSAIPPSRAYSARKFFGRHRGALVTACAFALVLIVATVVSVRQSIRANREAAAAQAVDAFLQNDLLSQASAATQSGPTAKPDPDLKVRTALDRAASRITGKFDRQPDVEAAIRDTIGQTYLDLGLYPEARAQLERARDLHIRFEGAESSNTLKTVSRLGRIAILQGKFPEAESLDSRAFEVQRRLLGPENIDTLYTMNGLATAYYSEGKYRQAGDIYRQTLAIRRRVFGPEHPETLNSMSNLALVYYAEGKYAEAEALDRQTLEIRRRVLGPEHPSTLISMNNLAIDYNDEGKYEQAEALDNQTLEIRRRVLGPDHPDTLMSMNSLANVYDEQGKYAQAEAINSQTAEIGRRVLGVEHPDTLSYMGNLALDYDSLGKYEQAEALDKQIFEIWRRILGPEHVNTLMSMNDLGNAFALQRRFPEAEDLLNRALEIARRALGSEHQTTIAILSNLASMYQREGKFDAALTYAMQALAARRHTLGSEHPDTMASAADLSLAYLSEGKFAESERLAREARSIDSKQRPDDWQRFRAESLLGASLSGQKKYAEAEPLLVDGYRGMAARKSRMGVPDWYHLDRARTWIIELYEAWDKPGKAAEWKKR